MRPLFPAQTAHSPKPRQHHATERASTILSSRAFHRGSRARHVSLTAMGTAPQGPLKWPVYDHLGVGMTRLAFGPTGGTPASSAPIAPVDGLRLGGGHGSPALRIIPYRAFGSWVVATARYAPMVKRAEAVGTLAPLGVDPGEAYLLGTRSAPRRPRSPGAPAPLALRLVCTTPSR